MFLLHSFLAVRAQEESATEKMKAMFNESYTENEDYRRYLEFFKEVYTTMIENYYHPVPKEDLSKFLFVFNTKIYPELRMSGKSEQFIKWRSSAYLVEALKAPDDIFSAFYPPKAAKDYEEKALGKKIDLGIEGKMMDQGFEVSFVEPRSDAFEKGLREKDVLLKIGGQPVESLSEEEILGLLTPLEGSSVDLLYRDHTDGKRKKISPVSMEYFKQTVFRIPVDVPHVYCLQIPKFNRKTGEDMERFMKEILPDKDAALIIDLRDNPGGPPLAAREISSFFLKGGEAFAYFQRNNKPRADLDVPDIPVEFHFDGPMVILVNEKSGSASELFSGVLKNKKRAVLMGVSTAGQVFLKSMFHFSDDSMVLLVTARGHLPDGEVFSFDGVEPDVKAREEGDALIQYAAEYLKKRS